MKSYVLRSKFIMFCKIICFTKQIYRRQVLIAKPRFHFYLFRFNAFYIFSNNFMNFIESHVFLKQNRIFWDFYGPIWAPTRTGPQPGPGLRQRQRCPLWPVALWTCGPVGYEAVLEFFRFVDVL